MYSNIETGAKEGSHTFEQCLGKFFKDKTISKQSAIEAAKNPAAMEERLKRL